MSETPFDFETPIEQTERAQLWRRIALRTIERPVGRGHWELVWPVAVVLAAAALVLGVDLSASGKGSAPFREFATAAGGRSTVTLRDGTQIILGPESHLRVPVDFGRHTRAVELDGEGYFTAVHDTGHPFAVLTHNLQINDVGTDLDVRAYLGDNETRVVVARGAVALVGAGRGNGATGYSGRSFDLGTVSRTRPTPPSNTPPSFQDIPLSAGDMADIVDGVPTVTHHADIAAQTAWMQGRLVFAATPLSAAAKEIGRVFGVRITVADSAMATEPVTGEFDDATVEGVLEAVTGVVGGSYHRDGRTIVIRRGEAKLDHHGPGQRPTLTTVQSS